MNIYVDASFNPHTQLASVGVPVKKLVKLLKARTPTEAELLAILCGVSVSNPGDVIITDCMTIVFLQLMKPQKMQQYL